MSLEMRCANKLHGIIDGEFIDVKCNSKFCGSAPGVVVIHRFSIKTGNTIWTKRFKDINPRKGRNNA